ALTKLVEIGPDSLPYLLEALDDDTPTQVTVEHSGGFGGMSYAETPLMMMVERETEELVLPDPYAWLNPANSREKRLLEKVKSEKRPPAVRANVVEKLN